MTQPRHQGAAATSVPTLEEEDASELRLGDDFKDAECITISDVYLKLKEKKEAEKSNYHGEEHDMASSSNNMVRSHFFDYAERFTKFHNQETLKQIKLKMERKNMSQFEAMQLINLQPEDEEEAQTLIPSLKSYDQEVVADLLVELNASATSFFSD